MDMQENEAAFDQAMSKYGGRLDLSWIDPVAHPILNFHKQGAQAWIDSIRYSKQTMPPGTMPYVYFDYIENYGISACASSSLGRQHFIGLNIGAVFMLHTLFDRALSHPEILPLVGEANQETVPPILPRMYDDFEKYIEYANRQNPIDKCAPVCRERAAHAHLLSTLAIQFLVAHELAHLRNGHIGLTIDRPSMSGLMKQCLEMDADAWATVQGITWLAHRIEDPQFVPKCWKVGESIFDAAVFSWCFAVYILFRTFDFEDPDFVDVSTLSHPPPQNRIAMVMATIISLLQRDRDENTVYAFLNTLQNVVKQSEQAFALLTFGEARTGLLLKAFGEEGVAHTKLLTDHWRDVVRPTLLPFSYANDLP